MWYKVDFYKLVVLLLPTFLRKKTIIAFLQSAVTAVDSLYYKWFLFRLGNVYKLEHSGQVCFLRKVLNDKLDPELRRIFIDDDLTFKRKYIYTIGEKKPNYLGKMYLRSSAEFEDNGFDFMVFVPAKTIEDHIYELKALLNFYKMGGKRYRIEQI